jgi:hypothetical protein
MSGEKAEALRRLGLLKVEDGFQMPNDSIARSAASQLADTLAMQSGPGFSKDPSDYVLPWVKLSGGEFNEADPKYMPEISPGGFLLGNNLISPKGLSVIVLGMTSGFEEIDRVMVKGEEKRRRYAIWRSKPDVEPVKGKGGGLRTDRGGWLKGRVDEVFMLTPYGAAVMTLFDQHNVVADLNQAAQSIGVDAMYKIKWTMTKELIADGSGYEHAVPHFDLLGADGDDNGPTKSELTRAAKLSSMIARISYPIPGVPLKLVANSGPLGEPPEDRSPPVQSENDYDGGKADLDDEIPF